MSFILDALKKSETERQEQGSSEFSSVPTSSGNSSPAKWLWMLAALLAVNFAVLIFILLKPDEAVEPQTQVADTSTRFEEQVAEAIEDRPVAAARPPATTTEAVATTVAPPPQAVTQSVTQPAAQSGNLPTIDQLRLDGSLQLEELHLDIHVYSDDPAERFVFINMDKHREDSRIDEGPIVREITTNGVILEYQGRQFLLPRE